MHAVRRTEGATVLDWSITPIAAPHAHLGDDLTTTADLGLTDSGSIDAVVLLDRFTRRVYRPLTHVSRRVFNHCLCTPVWRAQQLLRLGQTQLLQVAFPPLPAWVGFSDVAFGTIAPFFHVPVTPVGQLPTANPPTDLARPAPRSTPASAAVRFRYPGPPEQRLTVQVDRVVAGPGLTAMEWTIRSEQTQSRENLLSYGPPVSAVVPAGVQVVDDNAASGLTLRPAGSHAAATRASWMTATIFDRPGHQCLCTELGLWARALGSAGGSASVTTSYPSLPGGTTRVDVRLPGVTTVRGVAVRRAPDAALSVGPPVTQDYGRWTYPGAAAPPPWTTSDWPTPVPDDAQLVDFQTVVDEIVPLPRS